MGETLLHVLDELTGPHQIEAPVRNERSIDEIVHRVSSGMTLLPRACKLPSTPRTSQPASRKKPAACPSPQPTSSMERTPSSSISHCHRGGTRWPHPRARWRRCREPARQRRGCSLPGELRRCSSAGRDRSRLRRSSLSKRGLRRAQSERWLHPAFQCPPLACPGGGFAQEVVAQRFVGRGSALSSADLRIRLSSWWSHLMETETRADGPRQGVEVPLAKVDWEADD